MKFLRKINLEINKDLYNPIQVKQGDNSRYLLFNLLDNGVPFSLENKTVRVYGLKPDGTKVFNNLTIINAARGLAELQLTTQMLVKPGCLKLELVIYEATDILSTTKFDIDIISCIRDDGAIESTNEFSALTVALAKADEYGEALKQGTENIELIYATELNCIRDDGAIESTNEFSALTVALAKADEYGEALKQGTENIELIYATELNRVKSSLEEKANQNDLEKTNKNVSPIVPIAKAKGMAITIIDNSEDLENLKKGVDASVQIGSNTLIISININYNFANSNPEFCSTNRLQVFKDLCVYAKEKGVDVIAKMHTIPTSSDYQTEPTDVALWFGNYKTLVTEILSFCSANSITKIALHNELDRLTKEKFNTYWENIANYCKETYPQCSLGMSLTYQQAIDFTSYGNYDWFGFNYYPRLTTNGLNESEMNLLKGFYYDLKGRKHIDLLNKLKREYNKPIYITETGCCWREGSLESPGTPNYTGTVSEETQSIYLESMFKMFYNADCIDGIYVFCANTFGEYSIWGKDGRFIVKKWYGGDLQ